jgi:N-acetylglucosaminyldiphosphoundecaprenol N-acetyl-beta-D-mannosaminyltransferase
MINRQDMLNNDNNRVTICGVTYDNVTRDEAVSQIESFIRRGGHHMVCTPNADHIVQVRTDEEFRQIIANADLVVSDGMAVVYASQILGTPLKMLVGGRLLLPILTERSATEGYRIFLLGGSSPRVAEAATARLLASYPKGKIVGCYSPPHMPEFDDAETAKMLDKVNQSGADVLVVCLGSPKQEKWIARNLQHIEASVSIGIGVAMDMLAGEVRQPPAWVTEVGLEWLYRTLQEPKRMLKRYLLNGTLFLWLVLKERLRIDREVSETSR